MSINREHSAEQVRRMRRRVASLLDGAGPKRLKDRQRLVAAAHVGLHVRLIRDSGRSMSEICAYLGERMGADSRLESSEPFRIHRWMLKGGVTEVTDALVAEFKGRPEPLRTTAVYLRLLEHLALWIGRDPIDSQGALLTDLDLASGNPREEDGGPLPEQKLAALMNEHAAVMARNLDLVRLFQRAERLQAGWNSKRSAHVAVDLAMEPATGNFRLGEPTDRQLWLETAAPPLPAVHVARLPFGWLRGPFRLTNEAGETRERPGLATAFWDLQLAIGPTGPLSVGAYLLRSSSLDLELDGHLFTIPDVQDDVWQIVTGYPEAPKVELDGGSWVVTCDKQPDYRPQRVGLDEDPPSQTVPNLRIAPVTASSVRAWLMTPMDVVLADGPSIDVQDKLTPFALEAIGWVRIESIARSVEIALRDGRLEEGFRDWLEAYLPALDRFEHEWLGKALEMDADLRSRFLESDLSGGDP